MGHVRSLAPLVRKCSGVVAFESGKKFIPEPLDQLGLSLQSDFTVEELGKMMEKQP